MSMISGMEKYVRYYYFIHTGRNLERVTKMACPVYSTEGGEFCCQKVLTLV